MYNPISVCVISSALRTWFVCGFVLATGCSPGNMIASSASQQPGGIACSDLDPCQKFGLCTAEIVTTFSDSQSKFTVKFGLSGTQASISAANVELPSKVKTSLVCEAPLAHRALFKQRNNLNMLISNSIFELSDEVWLQEESISAMRTLMLKRLDKFYQDSEIFLGQLEKDINAYCVDSFKIAEERLPEQVKSKGKCITLRKEIEDVQSEPSVISGALGVDKQLGFYIGLAYATETSSVGASGRQINRQLLLLGNARETPTFVSTCSELQKYLSSEQLKVQKLLSQLQNSNVSYVSLNCPTTSTFDRWEQERKRLNERVLRK